jgi:sugar phosphate isomerase/epimerase
MMLSCSSPMVPGETLTAKAELLQEWGYDAIAVFQPRETWTDGVRRELRSLFDNTGVRPVEFVLMDATYGNAMADDLELRQRCRAMYAEAAEVCSEIGAVTEIEFQYGAQDPLPLFDPFRQLSPAQKSEFADFYRSMLAIVEGSDGRILLEPINRYESGYLNRVSDNLEILDVVAHPNAGLLPDLFHMSIEESDPAAALRAAGSRIAHVHLGDNNRLLPGDGRLPWGEIFQALRDVGFDRYVNLECSTSGDPAITLPKTAAMLRELIAG